MPIAITALPGEQISQQGAFNLKQVVQQLPSLNIQGFSGRNQTITIRGIGTNSGGTNDGLEQGVGIYVDGVYRPRTGSVITDLVDIESIQLLRGPQGTLFGKNTVAGAIDIRTREPIFATEVRGEATYGNRDYFRGNLSLNAALNDHLAFRATYQRTTRGGIIRNTRYNQDWDNLDNHSARFDLLWKPDDRFKLRFIADYSIQKGDVGFQSIGNVLPTVLGNGTEVRGFYRRAADVGYVPGSVDPFDRQTDIDSSQYDEMPSYGFQARADWDAGPFTLTSITAYRNWKWVPNYDGDQFGANIVVNSVVETDQQQFSQELRLASPGGATIDYTAGLYYFWQEADDASRQVYGRDAVGWLVTGNTPTAVPNRITSGVGAGLVLPANALTGLEAYAHVVPATKSYAAYGQATWNLSQVLHLTGGLRYTYESKTGLYDASLRGNAAPIESFPAALQAAIAARRDSLAPTSSYTAKRKVDNVSGTFVLAYDVTDAVHTYASYSRGYKSPGINLVRQQPGIDIFVRPEKVDAFELGLKSRLFDGAAEFNLALFWTEVDNYQANFVNRAVTPNVSYIANVGGLRSRGVEIDARATPTEGLTLTFAGTFNDATYQNYTNAPAQYLNSYLAVVDLSGQRAAGTPKWSLSGSAEYVRTVGSAEFYVGADASYRSTFNATVNLDPFAQIPGYALFGAHLGLRDPDGRWDVSLWARNLFDKDFLNTASVSGEYGVTLVSLGEPRLFGVTLRTRLGNAPR
ncbi:TonB-dependent receptor [Novosphingobium sp. PS1R-30]|uniref:TonB-dependent receptor n=1 Tax=Novosphingobium anseongense TaxID=3133436 RepID=A0ABU8S155_9SPHN